MSDLFKDVPKDVLENLKYRLDLRRHARKDPMLRAAIRTACREDVLYFFNAWSWLVEPRPEIDPSTGKEKTQVIPFIVWPHQEQVIVNTYAKLGFEDVGWNKTRTEGASWMAVNFAVMDWLFRPMCKIGLVSKDMLSADTPGNTGSLFGKIDWILTTLPRWMVGEYKRSITNHTLENLKHNALISAYSATEDVASGDRCRWFLMDELAKFPRPADQKAMASTQPVTRSRLIVSTFKGSYGAFYDLMTTPSDTLKCIIDWRDNPTKNRGLYRMIGGKPVAADAINNPLLPHYDPPNRDVSDLFMRLKRRGFNLEANTRSAWYDLECDRFGATPENIAEELDRDPSGSMGKFFSESFFKVVSETVADPRIKGNFMFRAESLETGDIKFQFDADTNGEFSLWCSLDEKQRPPKGVYALACDVAAGGGGAYSSNSVIEVVNISTGEQVLEFASNVIEPAAFADMAMAVGYWFWTAFLSYEDNGPGGGFGRRVAERRYPDVYKDVPYWKIAKNMNAAPAPGWHTDKTTKQVMFSDISMSVFEKSIIIRSQLLKEEFHQYIRNKDKIDHSHNPGADASHGDRVIAMAVCNQAVKQRPQPKPGEEQADPHSPPDNTFAARMRLRQQYDAMGRDEFREREPGELLGMGARRESYLDIF